MPNPCPPRPLVPPEPKLWLGEVKVHNTMTVRIDEDDAVTNDEGAQAAAQAGVLLSVVTQEIDIDIHETEAFRDGE